jgi:predicted lipoprotein with Yx(FWY)xxD motif
MKRYIPMPRPAKPAALASILVLLAAWVAGPVLAVGYGSPAPTANSAPARLQLGSGASATLGTFLVGPNGMTLYTLSSETSRGTVCTAGCLANWPPLLVAAGGSVNGPAAATGRFSTITRADDGSTQVAYNGRLLYSFANDTAAGQTNGERIAAFGGVWHVAAAALAVATSSPSASAQASGAAAVPTTSTGGNGSGDGPGAVPWLLLALLCAAATMVAVGALSRRERRA